MYKLLCIDLDGTLLDYEKKISVLNAKVLNTLYKKGIDIVIATGRHFEKVADLISSLKFDCSIIANNGAIALDGDEIFILNPVNQDLLQTVIGKGKDYGVRPYLHVYDEKRKISIVIPDGDIKSAHAGSVCNLNHICHYKEMKGNYDVLTIVFLENHNKISALYSDIVNGGYACEAHIMKGFRKDVVMVEFLEKGSNKAAAIRHYAKLKGIGSEEIIAIGDENNDIDMIESVGLGIAMNNATQSLKEKAKCISKYTNNNSGVGRELMEIFQLTMEEVEKN